MADTEAAYRQICRIVTVLAALRRHLGQVAGYTDPSEPNQIAPGGDREPLSKRAVGASFLKLVPGRLIGSNPT